MNEQKINLKFCYKLGKTPKETYAMLVRVYEDQAVSMKCVYEWFARFREGRESVSDNPRSGRPATSVSDENIVKVRKLITNDRRLTVRMIADELQINRESVRQIVTQKLGMKKTCCRLVPHHLTDVQKQARLEASQDFVETADATPHFLNCIVTADESWCLRYDPETKRQSMEWRSPASPRRKKVRAEKSRIKTMLITFFDCHGIIHKEFLPEGTTLNAARYIEILTRFMKRLRRVRPQYARPGSWFFVHDNARPHTANIVKQFLATKGVVQLEHPPYSPELNPPDFFLFPRLKLALKGKRFDDIPDIQRNVTMLLKSIPPEDFLRSFQDMYSRSQRCIVMGGDYFEGQ